MAKPTSDLDHASTFEILQRMEEHMETFDKVEADLREQMRAMIQAEFKDLRDQYNFNLRGAQMDHDNIIRLQTMVEQVSSKLDKMSLDMDAKHRENLAVARILEERVRHLEDAKLTIYAVVTVIAFTMPLLISLIVKFWPR